MKKERAPDTKEYVKNHSESLKLYDQLNRDYKQISDWNKKIREVRANKGLSEEQKREKIKQIEQATTIRARNALIKLRKAV